MHLLVGWLLDGHIQRMKGGRLRRGCSMYCQNKVSAIQYVTAQFSANEHCLLVTLSTVLVPYVSVGKVGLNVRLHLEVLLLTTVLNTYCSADIKAARVRPFKGRETVRIQFPTRQGFFCLQ